MKKFLPTLLLVLLSMVVSCSTDGFDEPNGDKYFISGSVQKGPFVLGSTINIQSLNNKLNPTGRSYITSTNDDAGNFDLGSNLSSKYAEILATGYYFDEVEGKLSQGMLIMRSITDLEDGGATNVNLLTTLIYNRTQNLVKNSDKSIYDATAQAERELFVALGIKDSDIPDVRCAKMDISQAGDHNALLLTISVALQYNRSTAALSELIAKLATDLADDGKIASDKVQSLYIRKSVGDLAAQVRTNLINRYNQLGTQNNVPHFDKYLGYFLDIDGNGIADKIDFVIMDENNTEFSATGGKYTLPFSFAELENCEFSFSEESAGANEWLTINTDGGVCQLIADYNLTTEPRSAELIIKERGGDASLSFHVAQRASFHIEFTYDVTASTKAFRFVSDAVHFTTELNGGNGVLLLTDAPSYIMLIEGPFISITIPESINSFTPHAFAYCVTLQEFKGKWASADGRYLVNNGELLYYLTNGLTDFTIPEDIVTIGNDVLYGSSISGTVTIPASVKTIKDSAFANCYSVSLFKFEELTPPVLANTAFDGVENLRISVSLEAVEAYLTCDWEPEYKRAIIELANIDNIPDNYRLIYTTKDNQKLNQIEDSYITFSHTYIDGQGVVVFITPPHIIESKVFTDCSSLTSITIPNSVTTIDNFAFRGCSSLTSITIPNSVTSIGEEAFNECSNLASITIPSSVTAIGDYTFQYCSSLTSVNIPNSVTTIGYYAFRGCSSITSVNIGNGVTTIESYAFMGCSSLTSIYCKATTPPSLGYSVFYNDKGSSSQGSASNRKIYVPSNSVDAYKREGWEDYASGIIVAYDFGTESN